MLTQESMGRIEKFWIDRDGESPERIRERRTKQRIALLCGPEIGSSATLQAAVLTAANTGSRCFPGGVSVHLPESQASAELLVPWSEGRSFAAALDELGASKVTVTDEPPPSTAAVVAFGSRADCIKGLQVTFDGWTGAVAPIEYGLRLHEREYCVLAGIAGGALAIGEIFFAFAGVSVEATEREVGLSLWRPDLPWKEESGVGVPVEYLPCEAWLLGLGHLCQAYAWCLGMLPYSEPGEVQVVLNEFDKVIAPNLDTGMLTCPTDVGLRKVRVVNRWLESRGFQPLLVERPFDEHTRRQRGGALREPALAMCGFDGKGPRWALDEAGFDQVVECGLGAKTDDFDVIELHTLGAPSASSQALWPVGTDGQRNADEERVLRNPQYREVKERLGCGHMELAGISIGVPFVGATAGCLALAECLRMLHGGERYQYLRLQLGCPSAMRHVLAPGGYREANAPRVDYQPRRAYWGQSRTAGERPQVAARHVEVSHSSASQPFP